MQEMFAFKAMTWDQFRSWEGGVNLCRVAHDPFSRGDPRCE